MKRYRLLKSQFDNASRLAGKSAKINGTEICGLLVDNGFFIELVHVRNKSRRGGGFSFYLNEIRAIQKMAKTFDHEILGTFHSHPVGLPEPGKSDRTYALDNSVMLIFDVMGKKAGLWRIKNKKALPLEFDLIS